MYLDQTANVQEQDHWERTILKTDPEAIDTRTPPATGRRFKLEEPQMSKNNAMHRAANGSTMKNHGTRSLATYSD